MSHALVVGGTRGIGRAVTRRLVADGHVVTVLGRRTPVEADDPSVRVRAVDLADAAALARTLDEALEAEGPVSAAVLLQRFRGDGDAWEGELDVSLTATRTIVERLRGAFVPGGGAIVLVSSQASRLVAADQPVGYHVGKAGLRQMARYYAVALGPAGVRVNCVTPGAVLKEESAQAFLADPASGAIRAATPLGRIATAADVAAVVALLCSDDAAFVTGQDLAVDGGLSLLMQETLASARIPGDS